jgi:hypothetical protein
MPLVDPAELGIGEPAQRHEGDRRRNRHQLGATPDLERGDDAVHFALDGRARRAADARLGADRLRPAGQVRRCPVRPDRRRASVLSGLPAAPETHGRRAVRAVPSRLISLFSPI